MNILAFDLATRSGFAALKDGHLFSGVWQNPHRYSDSPGAFMHEFHKWLIDMGNWHAPQIVAWEMVHPHSGHSAMVAYGLITRVQEWAYTHQIAQTHVYPNTLKKFATGGGRCGKDAMIVAMRQKWNLANLTDDNESDALAVLAWAMKEMKCNAM